MIKHILTEAYIRACKRAGQTDRLPREVQQAMTKEMAHRIASDARIAHLRHAGRIMPREAAVFLLEMNALTPIGFISEYSLGRWERRNRPEQIACLRMKRDRA